MQDTGVEGSAKSLTEPGDHGRLVMLTSPIPFGNRAMQN
jgi:hypothetical protein